MLRNPRKPGAALTKPPQRCIIVLLGGFMKTVEQTAAKKREWYLAHREETIARTLAWRKANPGARTKHRRTSRGVKGATSEKRNGPCELCGVVKDLRWDHDHTTGEPRGWLCNRCNIMVGWWEIITRESMTEKLCAFVHRGP